MLHACIEFSSHHHTDRPVHGNVNCGVDKTDRPDNRHRQNAQTRRFLHKHARTHSPFRRTRTRSLLQEARHSHKYTADTQTHRHADTQSHTHTYSLSLSFSLSLTLSSLSLTHSLSNSLFCHCSPSLCLCLSLTHTHTRTPHPSTHTRTHTHTPSLLTVAVRMEDDLGGRHVDVCALVLEHVVLPDPHHPGLRVRRQEVRPHRPASTRRSHRGQRVQMANGVDAYGSRFLRFSQL